MFGINKFGIKLKTDFDFFSIKLINKENKDDKGFDRYLGQFSKTHKKSLY